MSGKKDMTNQIEFDVEKLRKALEELMKFTCASCNERYCEYDCEEEGWQRAPVPCSAILKARDALAMTKRNLEVGTPW